MNRLKCIAKHCVSTALTGLFGDPQGRVKLTTRRGPAKGLRFSLDLRAHALEYAFWFGNYDEQILKSIAGVCKPGWIAWDCGTYLGFYTAFLARLVGPRGHVVAFEPDPTNLERTRQNVALNGLANVTFEHTAIGEPCGEIDLLVGGDTNSHINSHIPGMWIGATRHDYARIEANESVLRVPCTSLDDTHYIRGMPRPDLIKLDIEGAEGVALRHADRLCRDVRPLFVLELHNPECDRAAWDWAQRQNYCLTSLFTGSRLERAEDVGGTLLCSPAG